MSVAHDTHRVDDAVDLVESNLLLKAKISGLPEVQFLLAGFKYQDLDNSGSLGYRDFDAALTRSGFNLNQVLTSHAPFVAHFHAAMLCDPSLR